MSGHGRTNPQDKKNKQLNIIQPDNVVESGETLFPETDFGIFFLFIDVIVSVCEAANGMKRNTVGSCVRLKKWKGEGVDNTVNLFTLMNPKRVFKCSDFASCNIIFFPNAKSGTCHL